MLVVPGTPLPLDQVLPVWMSTLPLQEDKEEYAPVIDAIAMLLEKLAPSMNMANMGKMLEAVGHAATWAGDVPAVVTSLGPLSVVLKRIYSHYDQQIKHICVSFSPLLQSAIAKLLQ